MYKLIVLIGLFLSICIVTLGQQQVHNYLFTNKSDTVSLNLQKKTDTVLLKISLKINHSPETAHFFKMIEQTHLKEVPFVFIDKDVNGNDYQVALKPASYYSNRKRKAKSLYKKMTGEKDAFILNGTSQYYCLTAYKLQKNSNTGIIKMLYNSQFGPISLFINNNGEETVSQTIVSESFNLISVDGLSVEDYIKTFLPKIATSGIR